MVIDRERGTSGPTDQVHPQQHSLSPSRQRTACHRLLGGALSSWPHQEDEEVFVLLRNKLQLLFFCQSLVFFTLQVGNRQHLRSLLMVSHSSSLAEGSSISTLVMITNNSVGCWKSPPRRHSRDSTRTSDSPSYWRGSPCQRRESQSSAQSSPQCVPWTEPWG